MQHLIVQHQNSTTLKSETATIATAASTIWKGEHSTLSNKHQLVQYQNSAASKSAASNSARSHRATSIQCNIKKSNIK